MPWSSETYPSIQLTLLLILLLAVFPTPLALHESYSTPDGRAVCLVLGAILSLGGMWDLTIAAVAFVSAFQRAMVSGLTLTSHVYDDYVVRLAEVFLSMLILLFDWQISTFLGAMERVV